MELKEALKALDLPDSIGSVEDLVTAHNAKFVLLSEASENEEVRKKVEGRVIGGLETLAIREFGLNKEELKTSGKTFRDVLKDVANNHKQKVQELEETVNKGPDEKYGKLEGEHTKLKKLFEQITIDHGKTVLELDEEKKNSATKIKSFKTAHIFTEAKSKLPWSDHTKEVERVGFDALFNNKYVIDLDDQDNPVIMKKDGTKVANPTQTGKYLSLTEVLDMELDQAGLKKKNNQNVNSFSFKKEDNINNNDGRQQNNSGHERRISPKALAHAESMKEQGQ